MSEKEPKKKSSAKTAPTATVATEAVKVKKSKRRGKFTAPKPGRYVSSTSLLIS